MIGKECNFIIGRDKDMGLLIEVQSDGSSKFVKMSEDEAFKLICNLSCVLGQKPVAIALLNGVRNWEDKGVK